MAIRLSSVRLTSVLFVLFALTGARAEDADNLMLDWVAKYAEELNVRFGSRPFEQIGWAKDIGSALSLAKEHERPVFLFTLDGYFETGRC